MVTFSSASSSPQPRRLPEGIRLVSLAFVILTAAALLGVGIYVWFTAPDTVPSHFNAVGEADDWSAKTGNIVLLLALGLGLSIVLSTRPLIERLPQAFLNIPYKDHWLETGERLYLYDCIMEFLRIVSGTLNLLFLIILAVMMVPSLQQAIGGFIVAPTLVFVLICGACIWLLYRRLRPRR